MHGNSFAIIIYLQYMANIAVFMTWYEHAYTGVFILEMVRETILMEVEFY